MKIKSLFVVAALAGISMSAISAEYVCSVNCLNPSGTASVVVSAGSAGEAAGIVDKQSDQICQGAKHGRSTPQSMSASQCSKK